MSLECLSAHPEGIVLGLRVIPNAPRTGAEGLRAGRLLLRLQAPPRDNRANRAAAEWVAGALGARESAVSILRGEHSRDKDLLVAGVNLEAAEAALRGWLQG